MAGTRKTRETLLSRSVDALRSGRGATAGVGQNSQSSWLPVAEIMADSLQPRTRFDPALMSRLVESIRMLGQIEPIVVEPLTPEQAGAHPPYRYRCISGHRRLNAHTILGLEEIRALILREPLRHTERLLREVAANEVREDHTDFDRARYMARLLAEIVEPTGSPGESVDMKATLAASRRFANRVFNELDRSKKLGSELRNHVDRFESQLRALGERRNLRWFHRWGSAVLALEGAALEAAIAGLDARRALALASLSPRSVELPDVERAEREVIVAEVAELIRAHDLAHRDVDSLVSELAASIRPTEGRSARVDEILHRWRADRSPGDDSQRVREPDAVPVARASRRTAEAGAETSLADRARSLAKFWALRVPDAPSNDHATPQQLVEFVETTARRAPRRAERFLKALERASKELGER
jgi:ParB/RepB/Spo0J family partition protein